MDKNKRTGKRFQGQRDEEKMSLLQYDGGDADAPEQPEEKKDEKPDMEKSEKKSMGSEKKMESEKDPTEDPENTHCCCKYSTGMLVYGLFLWIFGLLILGNAICIFGNMYMPLVYPLVTLFIVLVYFAGLILLAIWWCNDNQSTRTATIIGGWLILGSIIALILWNVFFILNHNKHKKEGVKVGAGDDPDDYDEEDRSSYILGYLIWGLVIIVLDILFLACAINHADLFPPEDDEAMMMEEKKKEEMEKKEKQEGADDKGGDDKGGADDAAKEGGQRERRRRMAASSRSSSMRSVKSSSAKSVKSNVKSSVKSASSNNSKMKAAPAPAVFIKDEARLREAGSEAFKEIDNDETPRGSLKGEKFSYENGKFSETVQFQK